MNSTTKLKILLAITLAGVLWWYCGWTWLLVFPFAVFLWGANGSKWQQVDYIPHQDDQGVTLYYNQDGQNYRNSKGETHKMIERGKDTWPGRQRSSVNVELQRRNWGDDD